MEPTRGAVIIPARETIFDVERFSMRGAGVPHASRSRVHGREIAVERLGANAQLANLDENRGGYP